jgi:hypothetical protein
MTEVFVLIAVITACQVSGGSVAENRKAILACRAEMLECMGRNVDSERLRKCLIKTGGVK